MDGTMVAHRLIAVANSMTKVRRNAGPEKPLAPQRGKTTSNRDDPKRTDNGQDAPTPTEKKRLPPDFAPPPTRAAQQPGNTATEFSLGKSGPCDGPQWLTSYEPRDNRDHGS